MTATTSERRIVNMREVLNLLVGQHGETRERLVRIEDKVDVLVDDLAERPHSREMSTTLKGDVATLKGDVATLKGDVATLKGDVAAIRGDVAAIKKLVEQRSPPS